MSARIIQFPQRTPFAVHIVREDSAWLVVVRKHGWLFASYREAISEAAEIANGFGVTVMVAS